jgi:hypothetical protein
LEFGGREIVVLYAGGFVDLEGVGLESKKKKAPLSASYTATAGQSGRHHKIKRRPQDLETNKSGGGNGFPNRRSLCNSMRSIT